MTEEMKDTSAGERWKEDIRITQWWRAQLGDDGFAAYVQEDLIRWYRDFELYGAGEIRTLLDSRGDRWPQSIVRGISWESPHPPRSIVDLWLSSHESRIRMAPLWYGLTAFFLLTIFVGQTLSGCGNMFTTQPPRTFRYPTNQPPVTANVAPLAGPSINGAPTPPSLPLAGVPTAPTSAPISTAPAGVPGNSSSSSASRAGGGAGVSDGSH